jgi:uncharacterized membrane protein YhhN
MKRKEIYTYIFYLIALSTLVGTAFKITELVYVVKPLLTLTLIFLYTLTLSRINKLYIYAMLCCFVGDVFLLFKGQQLYFILGLVSFFLAHVFFIKIVFKRLIKVSYKKILTTYIPFLVLFIFLFLFISRSVGKMWIPVLIYGMVISLFVSVALVANEERRSIKSLYMLTGAIVFIISDSLLAVDKFYYSLPVFEVIVMFTYIVALYLIYRSMVLRKKYLY